MATSIEERWVTGASGLPLYVRDHAHDALPTLWPLFDPLGAVPALVLRGERSTTLTAACVDEMQRRHPTLRAATVPGRGHCPNLTEAASLAAVRAFLAEVAG